MDLVEVGHGNSVFFVAVPQEVLEKHVPVFLHQWPFVANLA